MSSASSQQQPSQISYYLAAVLLFSVTFLHLVVQLRLFRYKATLLFLALIISLVWFLNQWNVFDVFTSVVEVISRPDISFRSAQGIAVFCKELQQLAKAQYVQVNLLLTTLYLVLQSLCIPGTVALNAAIGALSGTLIGVIQCTLLGTIGALCCYTLSLLVGTSLIEALDRRLQNGKGVPFLREQVHRYRDDLFIYLLFLRLTPFLPNWLINLASPVVGVPWFIFASATALGILPQTYIAVRFGAMAGAEEGAQLVTVWDTLLLALLGFTLILINRLKKRFNLNSRTL